MGTKHFTELKCRACGLLFQPLDWMQCRAVGYCSAECVPENAIVEVRRIGEDEPIGELRIKTTSLPLNGHCALTLEFDHIQTGYSIEVGGVATPVRVIGRELAHAVLREIAEPSFVPQPGQLF